MTVLKWLVALALIGYFGGLAAVFLLQRAFLFPIPQAARTAPAVAGFPQAEEHLLTTDDGEKVIVWHVAAKPGHPVVLYFHGNGDFLAGFFGRFRDLIADGTGIVALSYRGYAGSSGRPSEQGCCRTPRRPMPSPRRGTVPTELSPGDFSLGSGVAVALAAEQPVAKLILEAPYTSIADVAASAFPIFPVRLVLRDPFYSDARIGRIKAPLLIMHGARDPTIPIAFGERLFALAHEPKRFVRFAEGGHNDLDDYGAIETARHFIGASQG
jgi:pimeloyl-ACP methyl ester carboxylesterase